MCPASDTRPRELERTPTPSSASMTTMLRTRKVMMRQLARSVRVSARRQRA